VVKQDRSVRICGDYKCTINQVSKLHNYPIPKTEDLLATLGRGNKFAKLDTVPTESIYPFTLLTTLGGGNKFTKLDTV